MKRNSILLFVSAMLAAGCGPSANTVSTTPSSNAGTAASATNATAPAAAAVDPRIPTRTGAKLQTIKLWLGAEEMVTELALTQLQMNTGMMFRTNMAENEGMLFVFPVPEQASFWMMNTILPLSAAYVGPDGTILEIHDLQPHDTNAVAAATDNIQYVLETPQGWFKRHNVGVGAVITSEKGSLPSLFDFHRK